MVSGRWAAAASPSAAGSVQSSWRYGSSSGTGGFRSDASTFASPNIARSAGTSSEPTCPAAPVTRIRVMSSSDLQVAAAATRPGAAGPGSIIRSLFDASTLAERSGAGYALAMTNPPADGTEAVVPPLPDLL